MKIEADSFTLSSGRKVEANCCIIGIGPDGSPCEGYDSGIQDHDWTTAEREELSLHMVRRWTRFAGRGFSKRAPAPASESGAVFHADDNSAFPPVGMEGV